MCCWGIPLNMSTDNCLIMCRWGCCWDTDCACTICINISWCYVWFCTLCCFCWCCRDWWTMVFWLSQSSLILLLYSLFSIVCSLCRCPCWWVHCLYDAVCSFDISDNAIDVMKCYYSTINFIYFVVRMRDGCLLDSLFCSDDCRYFVVFCSC